MVVVVSHLDRGVIFLNIFALVGGLRWRHVQEYVIGSIHEGVKELASEMLDTWIFEVVFDLELERSREGSQVMLAPLVVVLVSRESYGNLLFKVLKNALAYLILAVELLDGGDKF